MDVLGQQVVVASSAAWAERYRTTIEHAIGNATQISRVTWRPSVEILKEEGFKIEPSCKSLSHESKPLDCSEVIKHVLMHKTAQFRLLNLPLLQILCSCLIFLYNQQGSNSCRPQGHSNHEYCNHTSSQSNLAFASFC